MVRLPRVAFCWHVSQPPAWPLTAWRIWLRPFTAPPANMPPEAATRTGSVLLILWLFVGAIAARQRHYYNGSDTNCVTTGHDRCGDYRGPAQLHRRESEDLRQHHSQANEAPTQQGPASGLRMRWHAAGAGIPSLAEAREPAAVSVISITSNVLLAIDHRPRRDGRKVAPTSMARPTPTRTSCPWNYAIRVGIT
jgi:hypothetical protein